MIEGWERVPGEDYLFFFQNHFIWQELHAVRGGPIGATVWVTFLGVNFAGHEKVLVTDSAERGQREADKYLLRKLDLTRKPEGEVGDGD